jgi:hypothetical protein
MLETLKSLAVAFLVIAGLIGLTVKCEGDANIKKELKQLKRQKVSYE